MNIRVLIVIPLALVCGLSAVFLVRALRNPVAAPVVERTPVVFAVEEVKIGEMFSEKGVEIRQLPVEDVPEDAIRKVTDVVDRAARSTIDKGDMIREPKLAEKGAGRGMAALIKPGMRAFTIQTPSFSSSLAGFLLPGNRVDVLLTSTPAAGGDTANVTTSTLLEDVEILAVHTNVSSPSANKINPDEARSVTLAVTPTDAQRLDLGQNRGTLHLTLRNPNDKNHAKADPSTLLDLQDARPVPEVVKAVEPAPVVVVEPPKPKPKLRPRGVATIVLARTLRGTQVGRETLKVMIPAHDTLKSYAVATPYGLYRLDDSLVLEADPNAPAGEERIGENDRGMQLSSQPSLFSDDIFEDSSVLKVGKRVSEMGKVPRVGN